MSSAAVIVGLLGGILGLGAWDRARRDAARAAVPIRIHVNGTRGKSTVTRLIAGALRESGIRTVAKTTGAAPRLILPDGRDEPIRRFAPASIREQLWLLGRAHSLGAQALVAECMAIDPDLQEVSEREMIGATLGVITNARPDHGEVMGRSAEDVARALSRTIPPHATLVIGPDPGGWRDVIARAAERHRCAVIGASLGDPVVEALRLPSWQQDNVAIALAAARHLGIADDVAVRGMASATPDPGSLSVSAVPSGDSLVDVVDASSTNDPESLRRLVGRLSTGDVVVFNHRSDRPLRLLQFAESGVWADPGLAIIVTGDRPDWWSARHTRRTLGRTDMPYIALPALDGHLRTRLAHQPALRSIVFCGNSKTLDVSAVVRRLGR